VDLVSALETRCHREQRSNSLFHINFYKFEGLLKNILRHRELSILIPSDDVRKQFDNFLPTVPEYMDIHAKDVSCGFVTPMRPVRVFSNEDMTSLNIFSSPKN
jgi:hypothetical protein